MSLNNAIKQRENMIARYKILLASEQSVDKIQEINSQIDLANEEIALIKVGKPLFGRPKPLIQKTTIIEPDREKKGEQIVTVLNTPNSQNETKGNSNTEPSRLDNKARGLFQSKVTSVTENTLKAKIAAAKAAKKTS